MGGIFSWPLNQHVTCQRVGGSAVDIRSAQKLAWENKLAKGFNTTDIPLEFCLLSGEVAEAFDAWRKARPQVAEELADVAIYLLGLAEMAGADLQEAVEAKLAVNEARVYRRLPNGVPVKDAAATETPPPSAPQ
jgi:NTP pyrophosphatase (non-canonical NTP hydrolase)